MSFDYQEVQRSFGQAARHYDQYAWLQQEAATRLLERLADLKPEPTRIADLGCGTGINSAELKSRYPDADVICLDLAHSMVQTSMQHSRWRRRLLPVQADTRRLPFASRSLDLIFSNLCFQWCDQPGLLMQELRRVLRPRGLLVFSTCGPDTLQELRSAWSAVDNNPRVAQFEDMHNLGDLMIQAGLVNPVLEAEFITARYRQLQDFLRELKGLGVKNADNDRVRRLTGKTAYQKMLNSYEQMRQDGTLPVTWELVFGTAWGPEEGQPMRVGDGEVASFSIESMRGKRVAK